MIFLFLFGQGFVGLHNLILQPSLIRCKALCQFGIAQGHHLHSQQGCIERAVHANRCHGDARRHLDDGEEGIKAIEHSLDGHSDDGQCRIGCDDTRQRGGHTSGGNDDINATVGRRAGKFFHLGRCTMGRKGLNLEGHLKVFQQARSLFHNGQVGSAAHDNANHVILL